MRFAPISATQFAFAAATTHLLALATTDANIHGKRAEEARHGTTACGRILREMGRAHKCAVQTADIFEGLVAKWCPPAIDEAPLSSPSQSLMPDDAAMTAAQALDPDSELAKTLLRLGWKPPSAPSGGGPSAAPPSTATPPFDLSTLSSSAVPPPPLTSPPFELFGQQPSPGPSMMMPAHSAPAPMHAYTAGPYSFPTYSTTPLWPFFAPTAPHAPVSGNSGILSDDLLASLLSAEGRGATDYGAAAAYPFWNPSQNQ